MDRYTEYYYNTKPVVIKQLEYFVELCKETLDRGEDLETALETIANRSDELLNKL